MIKCKICNGTFKTAQADGIVMRAVASAIFTDDGRVTFGPVRPIWSVKSGYEAEGQRFYITCPLCGYRDEARTFKQVRKSALSDKEGTHICVVGEFTIYVAEDEIESATQLLESIAPVQSMNDDEQLVSILTEYIVPRRSTSRSARGEQQQ